MRKIVACSQQIQSLLWAEDLGPLTDYMEEIGADAVAQRIRETDFDMAVASLYAGMVSANIKFANEYAKENLGQPTYRQQNNDK